MPKTSKIITRSISLTNQDFNTYKNYTKQQTHHIGIKYSFSLLVKIALKEYMNNHPIPTKANNTTITQTERDQIINQDPDYPTITEHHNNNL